MSFKLFDFAPKRISEHHKRGADKRRPWRMVALSFILVGSLLGGASQTDIGKNNVSYWAASHAPSQYLAGLDRYEAATMAGRIATLNKSIPVAEVENSKYAAAASRLFLESQEHERAAVAASFVNKIGGYGSVDDIAAPARNQMIASLLEETLYGEEASQRQNAQAALAHFELEQDDVVFTNILSVSKATYAFSKADASWVMQSVERIARQANRAEDKSMAFAALRNVMGKVNSLELRIDAARAFAAKADEYALSKMNAATVDVLMLPLLKGYVHNKFTRNEKRAAEINVEMTRVETHAKDKYVSASYYKVVPQSTFNITNVEFSNMDHEHAGFLMSWLAGAEDSHKDEAVKKKSAETLERMYVNIGLDPDFLKYYAPHRAAWHKYVKSQKKGLDALAKTWPKLDDKQRLAVLVPWAKKHSEIFGFDDFTKLNVYRCSTMPKTKKKCSKDSNAYHGGKSDQTFFNGEISNWKSFEATFSTLIHENTHHHQDLLIKLKRAGKIAKDDARLGQISVFSGAIGYYVEYTVKKNNYKIYQSHPWERHAWWTTKNLKNERPNLPKWKSNIIDKAPVGLTGKYVKEGTGDAVYSKAKSKVKAPKPPRP